MSFRASRAPSDLVAAALADIDAWLRRPRLICRNGNRSCRHPDRGTQAGAMTEHQHAHPHDPRPRRTPTTPSRSGRRSTPGAPASGRASPTGRWSTRPRTWRPATRWTWGAARAGTRSGSPRGAGPSPASTCPPPPSARAEAAARAAGLDDRVRLEVADLADPATWPGDGPYDLVTACFLQTPLEFPRTDVLRRAAGLVTPGGHLLVVAHAAPPPWADVPPERLRRVPPGRARARRPRARRRVGGRSSPRTASARPPARTGSPALLLDTVVRAVRR